MKNIDFKRFFSLILSVCIALSIVSFSSFADNKDKAIAGGVDELNYEVMNPAKNLYLKVPQKNKIILGSTFQIMYRLSPKKSDDFVTYKNFNKDVVKVNEDGLVTAIGYGEARVQLKTSSGKGKYVYFTVTDINGISQTELKKGEATAIELPDKFKMIKKGDSFQITPVFYPLGIYDNVTYMSSTPDVVSVSQTGAVTALKAGTAVVTVTTDDGISAALNITVYNSLFKGIDVSKWQGDIDWGKVSADGVDFAMIRSSYGSKNTDTKLKKNVSGCEKNGINYGFYHYTYAESVAEAREEARYFLKTIKNYDPTYPVVLDIEEEHFKKMSRKKVTDIIVAFVEVIENAGYYAMVYSSPTFFNDYTNISRLVDYDIWIACWGDEDRLNFYYDGHYGMWQYSSTGNINGIDGDTDLNYAFKDYAAVIKKNGLNKG